MIKAFMKNILLRFPVVKKFVAEKYRIIKEKDRLLFENLILLKENKNFREKLFDLNQIRYKNVVEKLRLKIKNHQKIRVCFFVIFDCTFSCRPLFDEMLKNKNFKPYIVVVPDLSRSREHMVSSFNQTYKSMSKKYKDVYKGYDINSKKFTDFSKIFDIVCFPLPYENMTHKYFEIEHFLNKDILTFYVGYTFTITKFSNEIFKTNFYEYLWRIFVPTVSHLDEYKKYQYLKGNNVIVTGYCKMDDLAKQQITCRKRKVIIIAPHHTVTNWELLSISNFIKYSNFILKLPKIYPNVDFIFRPHPLLITQLKKNEIWGSVKTEKYIKELKSNSNLTYSDGGEYFNIFANSDGIIHDCGSFLAEYLFTEKPACYLLKDRQSINKWFLPFSKKCLEQCYQAFSKKDILNFIDNVIINNNDPMKDKRVKFVNSELKINYPNSSIFVLNEIKNELLNSSIIKTSVN